MKYNDALYAIKSYKENKKINTINIFLNIIFAILSVLIFGLNPLYIAGCFIFFDCLCVIVDKILLKKEVLKSIENFTTSKELKKIIDKFQNIYYCDDESCGLGFFWLKEIQNKYNKLKTLEDKLELEEQTKETLTKKLDKDLNNIENTIKIFEDLYQETNEKDKELFKPCHKSCKYITKKIEEGFKFTGSYDKQYVVYLQEFINNLKLWNDFTNSQKESHYEDMDRAIKAFEVWTKKTILSIEQENASDLRISIKTLANMLDEDIQYTQKIIDSRKGKEDNEN